MNWELIVRECHFVDNTAYIRALENCRTPVFLRPKRFGKSMVCSMLSHYYDILLKDRFDELFGMTETVEQAVRYRASLVKRPGWVAPVETAVIEVCGNIGYNWHPVA